MSFYQSIPFLNVAPFGDATAVFSDSHLTLGGVFLEASGGFDVHAIDHVRVVADGRVIREARAFTDMETGERVSAMRALGMQQRASGRRAGFVDLAYGDQAGVRAHVQVRLRLGEHVRGDLVAHGLYLNW